MLQKNKTIICENTDGAFLRLTTFRANVGSPGNDIPSGECAFDMKSIKLAILVKQYFKLSPLFILKLLQYVVVFFVYNFLSLQT